MKKIVIVMSVLILLLVVYSNNKEDISIVIPNDAIRVRVIANSNSLYDQNMKLLVKDYIEDNLSVELLDVSDIDDAREIINNNIDNISLGIKDIFNNNGYDMNIKINYGDNYFPLKEYKGTIYNEGVYESLVVTIGDGKGDNWWCVLFPPLCLLDAKDNDSSEVEYRSFVKDMLDRIF